MVPSAAMLSICSRSALATALDSGREATAICNVVSGRTYGRKSCAWQFSSGVRVALMKSPAGTSAASSSPSHIAFASCVPSARSTAVARG